MIKFILVYLVSMQLFSADIEALKKEKMEYKLHNNKIYFKKYKEKNIDKNRLIIVFKKRENRDINILEKKYFLVLEKCLVKRVCIFKIDRDCDLDKLKAKFPNIDEIKYYKHHQFKIY